MSARSMFTALVLSALVCFLVIGRNENPQAAQQRAAQPRTAQPPSKQPTTKQPAAAKATQQKSADTQKQVQQPAGQARKMRIIAFGAHPDDCEIQAGGSAIMWSA